MKQCCHIPEELLVEILCRLPRKSRCRFKCVSKQWSNLLSDPNRITPKTTKAGLVFHCFSPFKSRRATFLRLDNRGFASVDHSIFYNFKFRVYSISRKYLICDSSNGFFLLRLSFKSKEPVFLVYNPITDFLEHVPPPTNTQHLYQVALVLDGNHFTVIFFFASLNGASFKIDLYSSEDKKWRKKDLVSPPGLRNIRRFFSTSPSVFCKRAIHWLFPNHLSIYHLHDEFHKLIPLPGINARDGYYSKCIWEFEGRLHYCIVNGGRVDIWVLHMEEWNYSCSEQHFEWQLTHSSVLSPPDPSIESPIYSPFAFNEDFEILYIQCCGYVISYNPQTREQEVAFECSRENESVVPYKHICFPFLYMSD